MNECYSQLRFAIWQDIKPENLEITEHETLQIVHIWDHRTNINVKWHDKVTKFKYLWYGIK